MELGDISQLASYLYTNGDLILSGARKLVLTGELLHKLNEAFPLIVENEEITGPSQFQVINTNNSNFEIFRDLAFLHDFVQKTIMLKITNTATSITDEGNAVNIGKFGILKYLELNKFAVRLVSGIHCVQNHLQTLVCQRCLGKLEDVLKVCESDNGAGLIWSELRKAVFSYNALESLDESFKYTPWLQVVDLSHNRLTDADAIIFLPNLKCLNLSYNLIQSIPTFNKAATDKLHVLVLKFNYIEDLSGLSCLDSLKDLDLSCNCLMDHTLLYPLLHLSSLSWLSLEGNPVSYHKKHRMLTAQNLPNSATDSKFLLDGVSLSKSERLVVGTLHPTRVNQSLPNPQEAAMSISFSETVVSESVMQVSIRSQTHGRRGGKVREALISEYQETGEEEQDSLASLPSGSLEISTEHLETKKQIESLRERFGEENWLHSRGGSIVQDVLGLAQSPKPTFLSSSLTNSPSRDEDKANAMHQQIISTVHAKDLFGIGTISVADDAGEKPVLSKEMVTSSDSLFGSKEMSPELADNEDSHDDEDEEMEKHVYPVQCVDSQSQGKDELFLVVTKLHIKEKEISFGKTRERWTVASLSSCVLTGNNPSVVHLTFDTVRRDRQERRYIMEGEDAQNIVQTLGEVLDSRSLSAMRQTVFRCLNCSSQFSHELDSWSLELTKRHQCPGCQSTLVIEMDEVPDKGQVTAEMATLARSPSQFSIGATGMWPQGPGQLQVNAIVHCSEPPPDTQQYTTVIARSAASLDVSPEWPVAGGGHVVRRCDSDIEVISNPSQSSIEVLDERGTPIRKRSEERQTVPPATESRLHLLSLAGLTESSSSGSFTDSICTTYENRTVGAKSSGATSGEEKEGTTVTDKQNLDVRDSGNGCSIKDSESSTETLDEVSVRQPIVPSGPAASVNSVSLVEGLLKSVSTKLSRSPPRQVSESIKTAGLTPDRVEYGYKDYAQVDHRVKLHLHLHVFEEGSEQLSLLAKGKVMHQSNTCWYSGCVVFSTHKVYLLKITGVEGDDPEHWLKSQESMPLNQLQSIQALPWYQGICLVFEQTVDVTTSVLLLLQDKQRTEDLLTFLTGVPLVDVNIHIDELICLKPRSPEVNGQACSQLIIFNLCTITNYMESVELKLGSINVTQTDIMICLDLLWLFPQSDAKVQAYATQKMSNLIEVEVCKLQLTLHFLDELIEKEETWSMSLQTLSSLQDIVTAIKIPWEELFLVPLQVTDIVKSIK